MSITINYDLENALEAYIESLQISPSRFKQASDRYGSIGKWLNRDGSAIKIYDPKIYPQGSFALGTVIKPENSQEHYDMDLVCELNIPKNSVSQADLKSMVGKELALYTESHQFSNPLEEGQRCWSLNYTDEAQFHIDVLPSIPETDENYKIDLINNQKVEERFIKTSICITDKTTPQYHQITNDWKHSNPKGYAAWFQSRMQAQYLKQAQNILKRNTTYASVEQVPLYEVKTPLQKAIQILKRHRDMMFANDPEDKPISIIITTLAAMFYLNQDLISDTVSSFSQRTIDLINPVRPNENFADKWEKEPRKKDNFYRWVRQLNSDLIAVLGESNLPSMITRLGKPLGNKAMEDANKLIIKRDLYVPSSFSVSQDSRPWSRYE